MSAPAFVGGGPAANAAELWRRFAAVGLIPLLLLALVVAMALVEPRFYGTNNLFNILRNTSFLAILACGQMLVVIVGGLDLSVGAVAALTSVVTAKVMSGLAPVLGPESGLVIRAGVAAGGGGGAAPGAANGLCTTLLRVPALIVTLATMSIVSGLALILTSGIPVYGMPVAFINDFGRAYWWGLPAACYVAAALVAAFWLMQRRMVVGRYLYAIGGNPQAAAASGIAAGAYQVLAYVLCGVCAGVTGLLLTAQIGSGQANLGGDRLMLLSIAAAVVGGASLRGGIGRAEMVALSALFLSTLTNSLNLLRIDSKKELVILGLVLVTAVAIDALGRRRNHDE